MIWKIIDKSSKLKFATLAEEEYECQNDPLFPDEVSIQLNKNAIENFRFNNGYFKIHYSKFSAIIKNVYVEPTRFILIKGVNQLIKESIVFDWYRISYRRYINAIIKDNVMQLDKAVLFDAKIGLNVFHFYNDILVKLFIAGENFPSFPLLISERLYTSKLFQFYFQFEMINRLQWVVVPEGKYTFIKEAVLIKAKEYDAQKLKIIADLAHTKINIVYKKGLRLFVNRKDSASRYISNFSELKPVLLKHHFTILYLEDLSIEEQISYCTNATIIAGVHGAGLTNMIFAYNNNPKIIEISPADFIPTHYFWLAHTFDFSYNLFLGSKIKNDTGGSGFTVNVKRFDNILSTRY